MYKLVLVYFMCTNYVFPSKCYEQSHNATTVTIYDSIYEQQRPFQNIQPTPLNTKPSTVNSKPKDNFLDQQINPTLPQKQIESLYNSSWTPIVSGALQLDKNVVTVLENWTSTTWKWMRLTAPHLEMIITYTENWKKLFDYEDMEYFSKDRNVPLLPKVVGNPAVVWKTMDRLASDLPRLLEFSDDPIWKETVVDKIYELEKSLGLVINEEDVWGMSMSLVYITDSYDMRATDMFRSIDAKYEDYMKIATHAMEQKYYSSAIAWLIGAEEVLEKQNDDDQMMQKVTDLNQSCSVDQQTQEGTESYLKELDKANNTNEDTANDFKIQMELCNKKHQKEKLINAKYKIHQLNLQSITNIAVILKKQYEERMVPNKAEKEAIKTKMDDVEKTLCRGEDIRPPSVTSRLRCRLEDRGHPLLRLAPIKLEEIHMNPEIVVLHNLVHGRTAAALKMLALPLQQQAGIRNHLQMTFSHGIRSSFTAWLKNDLHKSVASLNTLVKAYTGYNIDDNMNEAETLQMNVYGAGGYYRQHRDALELHEKILDSESSEEEKEFAKYLFPTGDRITTVMFYLSTVEAGGRTIFPHLGVSVAPISGAAVVWRNVHKSGRTDYRTLHASCPVIRGTKWVCNKWIKYSPQMFLDSCGLTEDKSKKI